MQWLNQKQETGYGLGGSLASTGRKQAFLGRRAKADRFGDVLFMFNPVLQPLGGTAYIPTVPLA